jgi:hypothetical protein
VQIRDGSFTEFRVEVRTTRGMGGIEVIDHGHFQRFTCGTHTTHNGRFKMEHSCQGRLSSVTPPLLALPLAACRCSSHHHTM